MGDLAEDKQCRRRQVREDLMQGLDREQKEQSVTKSRRKELVPVALG